MQSSKYKYYRTWIVYIGFIVGSCGLADLYLQDLSPSYLMMLGMAALILGGELASIVAEPAINTKAIVRILMTQCKGWPENGKTFMKVAPIIATLTGGRRIVHTGDAIKIGRWKISRQKFDKIAKELKLLKD